MYLLILLVAVSNIDFIYSDICADINYECDECLGNSFNCVWCSDEVHNDTRCRLSRSPVVTPSWCQNLVYPIVLPVLPNIIKDEDFRPKTKETDAIQLKPQHVAIKARPYQEVEFTLSYKPAMDHAVDIDYLLDNSIEAEVLKRIFEAQESKIVDAFKEISEEVRFGVSLGMKNVPNSETDNRSRNYLNSFLENLLQILEIKDSIWISGARKIIILFCNPTNEDSSEIYVNDNYVRKINQIATENRINIVFIGFEESREEYKALAKKIHGTSYVELKNIADDEVDVEVDLANIVKNEYVKMVNTLELDVGVFPAYMSLKIKPNCEKFGQRCVRKINPGTVLKMDVTLSMFKCPLAYGITGHKDMVTIKTIGSHEILTIDTDILCYCDCTDDKIPNSVKCNLMGDYVCGVCQCYENRYGESCQCVGDVIKDGWQNCRASAKDFYFNGCDGHGDCICGVCHCHEGFTGKHCTIEIAPVDAGQSTEIPATSTTSQN